mmetsp:Transcript_48820/g.116065  ORF Transcript_48820/g.116065 Transcript_48820/m.116065 type:complete len:274 (-) Transcript_48820:47-868(-)
MAANGKYVFAPCERGIPKLQRGYRTPDPSPSPSIEGLVALGKLELRLVEVEGKEGNTEENAPTPRGHRYHQDRETTADVSASRTPSPSPSRSSYPASIDSKNNAEFSDECTTPRRNRKMRFNAINENPPQAMLPELPANIPPMQQWTTAQPQCIMVQPMMLVPPPPEKVWSREGSSQSVSAADDQTPSDSANDGVTQTVEADGIPSLGSRGHPYMCADACKYVKKRRGCKDGPNCDRCHLCSWSQANLRRGRRRNVPSFHQVSSGATGPHDLQ